MMDELKLIVPVGHRLAGRTTIKPLEILNEKFILREEGSATRAAVAAHLRKLRIEPEIVMEIENPESVKKAVQSGLGIAIISTHAVESDVKAKTLVALALQGLRIRRELRIVYRKDKHLSRAAHAFIEMAGPTK